MFEITVPVNEKIFYIILSNFKDFSQSFYVPLDSAYRLLTSNLSLTEQNRKDTYTVCFFPLQVNLCAPTYRAIFPSRVPRLTAASETCQDNQPLATPNTDLFSCHTLAIYTSHMHKQRVCEYVFTHWQAFWNLSYHTTVIQLSCSACLKYIHSMQTAHL